MSREEADPRVGHRGARQWLRPFLSPPVCTASPRILCQSQKNAQVQVQGAVSGRSKRHEVVLRSWGGSCAGEAGQEVSRLWGRI